jgi:hypothetical protein
MQTKYSDIDIWLSAAIAAVNGLSESSAGGSDAQVNNVVDVAARTADVFLVKFRDQENALALAAENQAAADTTASSHKKKA